MIMAAATMRNPRLIKVLSFGRVLCHKDDAFRCRCCQLRKHRREEETMIRRTLALTALLTAAMVTFAPPTETQSRPSAATIYEGARIIPGNGNQPIANGAMLVENGMITKIGAKGSVDAPRSA